jgi:hypothetical protein
MVSIVFSLVFAAQGEGTPAGEGAVPYTYRSEIARSAADLREQPKDLEPLAARWASGRHTRCT